MGEYLPYLEKIWSAHWVTNNGRLLLDFERRLQRMYGTQNILAVSNGTLAIQLALKALPKKSGEIITTPFTFQATTSVISWEGYTPVFADIDPETFNIDPAQVERKITPRTVAILAVHVYGNACDTDRLEAIAKKHHVTLIYDAAHAFDVIHKGTQLASYGDLSTFSFHATKTFHTIEGGAILCKDSRLFGQLKLLRNFGIESEDRVISCGINAKMNEFQAAMGLANFRWIKRRLRDRKRVHQEYMKHLPFIPGIRLQKIVVDRENYTYLPIILPSRKVRDAVYAGLKEKGIGTRKYFYPLTTEAQYIRDLNIPARNLSTPIAKDVSDRVLCLPMYASLTIPQVTAIIRELRKLI